MMIVWMVKALEATWHDGYPEYYRIVITKDDELEGQYYNHKDKSWHGNSSKNLDKMKWLFVETDVLVVEVGDHEDEIIR